MDRAVAKIEVDQRLVGYSRALGQCPEVRDGGLVDPQSDLFLQPSRIGILASLGEVVLFPHFVNLSHYCFCSAFVARRALISRMREPLSRTQWQTDSTRSTTLMPSSIKRSSTPVGSGSSSKRACSSRKAVSLLEGHSVLTEVLLRLGGVPGEPQLPHKLHRNYIGRRSQQASRVALLAPRIPDF